MSESYVYNGAIAKEGESSDEEMRKLLKPLVSEDHVFELLKTCYVDPQKSSEIVTKDEAEKKQQHEEKDDASVVRIEIVKQLDSYDDCNFHVKLNDHSYLLKIHNGVESKDFIECLKGADGDYFKRGNSSSVLHFQNALLQVFQSHGITSNVPVTPFQHTLEPKDTASPLGVEGISISSDCPVSLHNLPVASGEHSPCWLAVRLMTWVEGRPMSDVSLLPLESLADAGRFLGRMDTALDTSLAPDSVLAELRHNESREFMNLTKKGSFDEVSTKLSPHEKEKQLKMQDHLKDVSLMKAARRYHQWDGKNLLDLRPFVQYIRDAKRRSLVLSVLDAFDKNIIQNNVEFRKGINHADFNDANIMIDHNFQVSGVIDFGDSVESWRVLDISVAMAYAMLTTYGQANRSISAAAAMLRGYNSVYPLTDTEREHLVLLIVCRLTTSCTLGAFSITQNPENHYLLLHAEPAWKALETLWGFDEENRKEMAAAVKRVFTQACLYTDSRQQIITCYDLVMPDPMVADLLQSVRVHSLYDAPAPSFARDAYKMSKKRRLGGTDSAKEDPETPIITFVTGNAKKLEEVKRLLGFDSDKIDGSSSLPYQLTNNKIDLPELQGDAVSVAREKCMEAAKKIQGAVIVEDTSLCFNALNGMPGVFIKWFLDACGHDGLNNMIKAYDDKSGYAQTVVAFSAGPGQEPAIFDGRTKGTIVPPRGKLDFGWDPIFQPDEGGGKTYAEMEKDEKDAISHRGRAFSQLHTYLDKFRVDILQKMNG